MISINNNLDIGQRNTSQESIPKPISLNFSAKVEVGFSLSIDQKPQALAYQAAIDRINEAVAPYLGDQAIERGSDEGIDVSPQATAGRIVSLSTAFFDAFQRQRPQDALETVVKDFIAVISGGVEKGFAEAKDILAGLGVLEGDIEENINTTFDLVMVGLSEFAQEKSGLDA